MRRAIEQVPSGRWGVGVSGGADSVALLHLLHRREVRQGDVQLVVVHVDHEMRGEASRDDARFAQALADELHLPFFLRRRGEIEASGSLAGGAGAGLSGRLRRLRLVAFREAAERFGLAGLVLAHHADDVAETLLLRLLRGNPRSGTLGLAPLRLDQTVTGVRLLRPLLGVRRRRLRRFLERTGQPWREDASNESGVSLRNRLRLRLAGREDLIDRLLALSRSAAVAEGLLEGMTPVLPPAPAVRELAGIPAPLLRRAARRWLVAQGVPESSAGPNAVDGLLAMTDAAGPRAMDFPGSVRVRRHRGRLRAESRGLPGAGPGRADE